MKYNIEDVAMFMIFKHIAQKSASKVQPIIKFLSYADLLKVADGFWESLIAFMACLEGWLTDGLVATLMKAATIESPSAAFFAL